PNLRSANGDVFVLSGDTPLLTADVLRGLVETHRREAASATVLSFEPPDPRAYGRIVRDGNGRLARIVEAADATPDELELREVSSGIYVFKADVLWPLPHRLQPHNAQGELYVPHTVGLLGGDRARVAVHAAPDPVRAEGGN